DPQALLERASGRLMRKFPAQADAIERIGAELHQGERPPAPAQAEPPAQAPAQALTAEPANAGQFANNKLFTADAVAAARERVRKKLAGNTLNANGPLDPELLLDGMTIAGAYIESGVREFGA